jgi:DNA-binding transcriptional regulator YhcF (GntR family)
MEQIERQVMEDVATGSIRPGERLPTPLELGAELGVSAGAVEKAYKRLTKAGIIVSQPGVGPFIAETAISTQHALYTVAGNAIAIALNRARRLGCTRGDVELLFRHWLDRIFPRKPTAPIKSSEQTETPS